ncbi:MAG: hypothetical protein ACREJC_14830 [Tepidisphaeraceae bacterium]
MSEQNLLTKIGTWFRRPGNSDHSELPLLHDAPTSIVSRSTFLRPWARRDAAIQQLQDGFTTLTELMSAVRDNLNRQGQRQDELMSYLAHLPEVLQSLPESNRMQGQTLDAIRQQIQQQNSQQEKLSEILRHMSRAGGEDREALDSLRQRVESLRDADQVIADNLSSVGAAMQSLGRSGQTSTMVLEQMRDRIDTRDGQLERVLQRQGSRFTTMLAVAIFLSIAALVTVCVFGYLLLNRH